MVIKGLPADDSGVGEEDRVVDEKRLPNDLEKILAFLQPCKAQLSGVAVESTFNWYWLVDGLQAGGFNVHLANPGAIKKYEGLKHSGDESDARYLAHLLRLNILPTGTILAPQHRALRDLARQRGARLLSNQVKGLSAERIEQMGLHEDVAFALKANLAVIDTLSEQIGLLEKRLQEKVGQRPEYKLLTSVPGIGQVLATTILLETGPIERFAAAGQFASYARCVNSVHTSNGKKKGAGNTRNGNKYLAWAFVEAAYFAMRYCAQAKRFYARKKAKTNTAVAIKALAHKLARACFHILKERKPFDVTRCFA
ncbi:transposase [Alcaligenaceae bacterium]|nr:transposase [Alcaligenaceae bacterium]